MKQISTEYWHDGNILTVSYFFPLTNKDKAKIIIEAEIYPGTDWAAKRQKVRAEFHNVQNIKKDLDYNGIIDNVGPGSIDRITEKEILLQSRKFKEYTFKLFGSNRRSTNKIRIISNKVKIKAL